MIDEQDVEEDVDLVLVSSVKHLLDWIGVTIPLAPSPVPEV